MLTARADAKTTADCAVEVSYVMQLAAALVEAEDIIAESTDARHRYLDVQREHEETLEQQGGGKRRATGTTRMHTPARKNPFPSIRCPKRGHPNCRAE